MVEFSLGCSSVYPPRPTSVGHEQRYTFLEQHLCNRKMLWSAQKNAFLNLKGTVSRDFLQVKVHINDTGGE